MKSSKRWIASSINFLTQDETPAFLPLGQNRPDGTTLVKLLILKDMSYSDTTIF